MTRVLMTTDAVGGVWQYTLDLSRALRARGVEVRVAVLGPPPSAAQRNAAEAAGLNLVELAGRLEWMDQPWDDVDDAAAELLEFEEYFEPDVIHLNGYALAALPWRAPAIVVAHSCVCSWWRAVHGERAPASVDTYRERVMRGLAQAMVVVSPSAAMLEALAVEYEFAGRARVIPNATTLEPATHVMREPLVFTAGRLWDPAKSIAALCAAASDLPWPVVVAGDACDPQGRMTAVTGGVRHLGVLDSVEMREWYARASVYALPARYEPFGLSVLEAARAGCALVLGDIPSLRENWEGAAVFVPPDDRQALAAAISRVCRDEVGRQRLVNAARARAATFTIARMVTAYLDLYDHLSAEVA